ncbi:MAG: protease inhibitor I42 family protein [Legionella sp.]|nr:protease inhibitor I42 family protein [Legionella sp.]
MRKHFFVVGLILFVCVSTNMALASKKVQVVRSATCAFFDVKLSANPTTGFQWTLQSYDKTHFNVVKNEYIAPTSRLMGASGEHVFYFEQKENTACPESTVLCFRHARPWLPESAKCTEVTVYFK